MQNAVLGRTSSYSYIAVTAENEVAIVSYSMVILYIRDHGDLGFSGQKYHQKTSFAISF